MSLSPRGVAVGAVAWVCAASACGPAAPGPASPSTGLQAPAPTPVEAEAEAEPGPDGSSDDQRRIAAIEDAVNATGPVRHQCWQLAAADDFRVSGRVVLELTFTGGAPTAAVVTDEAGDPVLTRCLVELYTGYAWPDVFAPGQVVQLPFSFEAPRVQYTVNTAYVEPASLAGGKLEAAVVLDPRSTGNGAAALSLLAISGGLDIPLHRHAVAEILYVRAGGGVVYGAAGPKRGTRVSAGSAIYIPAGAPHGFVHTGDEPCRLVQVYAPAGPEQRFRDPVQTAGTTPVTSEQARAARRGPQPIVRRGGTSYPIAGGQGAVEIVFDRAITGDDAAYLSVLTARPGVSVPPHRHPGSTEVLVVVAGEGRTLIDGTWYPTAPGVAVQIPANTEHAFEVTGTDELRAIQLYTPAGPEQRFKGTTQ